MGVGARSEDSVTASWRELILHRILTAAALTAPPIVGIWLLARSPGRGGLDDYVLVAAGVLLVSLRLWRRPSIASRTLAVILIAFLTSIFALARIGFGGGVGVAMLACSVLAVIYLGRRLGLAIAGLSVLAIVGVGVLVSGGTIGLLTNDLDPSKLRNWIRMASTTSLLAILLALVVDGVINLAEAGARNATEALADLRLAYRRLKRLHHLQEVAREEERLALSQRLQVDLGQALTQLRRRLQSLPPHRFLRVGEPAPAEPDSAADLVDGLLSRIDKMAEGLRPPRLAELGLVPSLRAFVHHQAEVSGVAMRFEALVPEGAERLHGDLEIVCFRIVQESLTNVVRHASATRAHVRLVRGDERLFVSVEDDGRGFPPSTLEAAAEAGHLGVAGMRERVRARGGSFSVRSAPSAGTVVEAALPVQAEEAPSSQGGSRIRADRAARLAALVAWRQSVRKGMLAVAGVVAPVLAALAIFIEPSKRYPLDYTVFGSAGILLPVLWALRRPSEAARSAAAIAALFAAGLYVLVRAGFATGVSVLLVATCLLALVCFGRLYGFLLIAMAAVGHVIVGLLVTHGGLVHDPAEVDPARLENWIRLAALILLVSALLGQVVHFVIAHVERNSRAAISAAGEVRRAYAELQALYRRLEASKEAQRRFLAHELHDEFGQTLTALKLALQLGARAADANADPDGGEARAALFVLVDEVIARVRHASQDLWPPLLDEAGFIPALRAFVDQQRLRSGVDLALDVEEARADTPLAREMAIVCFRIAQEAITNALRHASAQRVLVRVSREPTRTVLVVRDDGRGFDPIAALETTAATGRLGMAAMQERVQAYAGSLTVTSQPGAGTVVEAELPTA